MRKISWNIPVCMLLSADMYRNVFDSMRDYCGRYARCLHYQRGTPEVEINLPAVEYIRRQQFTGYTCTFDIYPGQSMRSI